jgi:hypothetical protein
MLEKPMTQIQVAEFLGVTDRRVRNIPPHDLPFFKVGRGRQYLPSDVQLFMEKEREKCTCYERPEVRTGTRALRVRADQTNTFRSLRRSKQHRATAGKRSKSLVISKTA